MDKKALPLDKWLLEYAKERAEMCKRGEDERTQIAISLIRRFRGASLSDRVGRFIPGGTGLWRGDSPEDLEGVSLKCVNIVKPAVRMNQSALASARVTIDNEAANKNPELEGAANVCDGLTEFFDGHDDYWSSNLETRISQMVQTGYGAFIHTYHDPYKPSREIETQEWSDQEETLPGEYSCKCGSGGTYESDDEDETKCSKCGGMAQVTKPSSKTVIPFPGPKEKFNPGDLCVEVSSCFEHRVDEKETQGGNLLRAKWLEHHYLVTEDKLAQDFPDFDFGPPGQWSYSLRWKYALESGNDVFTSNYQSQQFNKRHERRDLYLLPEEYAHRVEPADYMLKDGQGNVVISIKRGEKLIDKHPNGFCFSIVSEKVAPYWREADFRDEWVYLSFTPDAHSFWGQPLIELLQLQDDWNTLYTIDIKHRERNSLSQIVYNAQMFDADAWERDLVPTAEGYTQGEQPISHYFQQITAAPMSEAVQGLEFLFKILPYVGGAIPEAIGVDPPGEDNYSAQLLRKQSSLGQLQAPAESKATAKVRCMRNLYKLAQAVWPEDRFEYIRTRFGEEWKEDDVEMFLNCDLETDIVTDYVEGTEIPTSYIERRLDLENAIQKYVDLQFPPPKELLKQYFDLLNLDYDMGMGADERLAESRYRKMKEGLRELTGKVSDAPIIDGMTGMPTPSMLIQAVMSHPSFQVKPKENHELGVEFYVGKQKALMADEMPDLNLLACLDEIIARHEAGGVQEMQSQTAQEIEGQAPAIQAQQELEAANQPPDNTEAQMAAEGEQKSAEMEMQAQQAAEDRDFEATKVASEREHELMKMDKEFAQNAAMKQMELESRERTAKEQAKRKVKKVA